LFAGSNDPKYEHISEEDRKIVRNACDEVEKFIVGKVKEQESRSKTENPVITVNQINAKKAELEKTCNNIMNKPKPIPKKEEPKKEEPKKEEPKKEEAKKEEAKKEEPKKEDSKMDLD